ncbi:MAG: hypothetical protein RLZZ435_2169 [Cyanobacteriota bacterium]
MFVNFFIKRPVFTSVCALATLLIGLICIPTLPIAQYPDISPKQVTVNANFIGADAATVENSVTNVLERAINGVEGMRYMTSSSSNDGSSAITVTFAADRDENVAAVDVQNRISVVEPQLPESVVQSGVSVSKQSNNILLGLGFYSEDDRYDSTFLSNYADLYIVDALKQVPGVASIRIFGERKYAMRIWLNPDRLASRQLTADDVIAALREQNLQASAGRIGQAPVSDEQGYEIDLRGDSRLTSVEDFEEVVISRGENGNLVQLKDVGRVELGSENYNTFVRFRGKEAVGLGIFQLPSSNALEVAQGVKAKMKELAANFPQGIAYDVGFDTTDYVEQSMKEVVNTLLMAVGLVIVVILIFLQDGWSTVIPAITIPVSLIGTFAFVKLFGFSINSLTLFGLTLASGMVVDDAIVVVEDISRRIKEGLDAKSAAIASMRSLTGAVIATSLVLMAVFVPVAFFPGTTGALYRQFALTIAFSIAVSTFNALTLTPALSALLLRNHHHTGVIGWCFDRFNDFLVWIQGLYGGILGGLVKLRWLVVAGFATLLACTYGLYGMVPGAFLPDEDQGYFIVIVGGPQGVGLSYTREVMQKIEAILLPQPEVRATFAVGGFGFSGSSSNNGVVFVPLQPWSERTSPNQSALAVIARVQQQLLSITEARILPINPPAVRGLGSFGGFQYQLQDRRGTFSLDELVQTSGSVIQGAMEHPKVMVAFTTFSANSPQLKVEVNRRRAKALDVNIDDIYRTLQTYLGSRYVNDFSLARRNYRVYVQADEPFRNDPQDVDRLYVRSNSGEMISLGSLVTLTSSTGAQTINHYNLARSIEINGLPAWGASSGDAIAAMEEVSEKVLPRGFGYEWSGLSREEIESGGQAPLIFGLGLVFVFLALAAQYESYVDPVIIMVAVPLAILGALLAQFLRGFPNDIYGQVGLVMLIGLASKNSILIVEFANQLREEGKTIVSAAVEAAQQRLRPILMTSISTLMGIFPLVIATGAGAGSRQSLGTAVFGGMFFATFLSLFVVPVLYIVIKSLLSFRTSPSTKALEVEELERLVQSESGPANDREKVGKVGDLSK